MAADERLLWLLRKAGEEWGALGVALVAASLTDVAVLRRRLSEVPAGGEGDGPGGECDDGCRDDCAPDDCGH